MAAANLGMLGSPQSLPHLHARKSVDENDIGTFAALQSMKLL
jgi:hypothetical protein